MADEVQFPIGRFQPVGSWMSEVDHRLTSLEYKTDRLDRWINDMAHRLKELEDFRYGVQVVMKEQKSEEHSHGNH